MERIELVRKTVSWIKHTDNSVKAVGGCGVEIVLEGMSDDLLYTMIANGLMITPRKFNE